MPDHRNPLGSPRNALVSGDPAAIEIASFLRHLEALYQARQIRSGSEPESEGYERMLFSLELAIASLDRDELHRSCPELHPQIGLLGPTQAGKSSLTNWLLGSQAATVSPLAGYTIHPQGFWWGADGTAETTALASFFHGLQQVAPAELTRDRLDRYSLSYLGPSIPTRLAATGCVWDTPDFDSVDSEVYRKQVLRIAALCDVVVLVISKDKYADQTVWSMASLLEPLGQPALVVMNKVDEAARSLLLASLDDKWRAARRDKLPPTVTIPFMAQSQLETSPPSVTVLLDTLRTQLATPLRRQRRQHTAALVRHYWADWMMPVTAEQTAEAEWLAAIADAIDEAHSRYQRDYLDHPHHYETFQRALARLLTLLEIPGVAGAFSTTRRVLTWPFRTLWGAGRKWTAASSDEERKSAEETILEQIADHVLLRLLRVALAKRDAGGAAQDWWHDIAELLRHSRDAVRKQFGIAVLEYLGTFQPEIEATARELYERLEEKPVVLNSLRATRITTDAAALALALHSGGIGIQDFVIAPATLSVTSMLMESALGRYVDRAADRLKRRQSAAVAALWQAGLSRPLSTLPGQLEPAVHFQISPERMNRIEALLKDYAHPNRH